MNELPTLPATHVCEQARLSRDARFDGLFFTAVASTGIYCRPVCPAPAPKRENVRYYANAAAAEAAGFRPCLRCRPELAPGNEQWQRGDHVVARALKLIEAGALAEQSLDALAARVGIGARQLRRLFVERIGAPPVSVHTTRRLLFAKQLLTETALPVTEVALASGFRSLRRFNAAFAQANRIAPRELRRHPRAAVGAALLLRLGYRPPYAFDALLAFLRTRALPGVEQVDEHSYARVFGPADAPGWLRLSAWPGGEHALQLQLHCPQPTQLLGVVTTLRRMFDLDANPQAIADTFRRDAVLGPLVTRHPGLRLPGGWDGFEIAVRAILGQQISVAAARTLATRVVQRWGEPLPAAPLPGLERLFPTPADLAQADLREIGLTTTRAATISGMAQALLDGRVDFRAEQSLDAFVARWVALPGIGAWTAHYIAMRALSDPDAFPAADLILRREAAPDAAPLSTKALTERADAWRPWRAYAVIHLWRGASEAPSPARRKKPEATA
ncbi:MULTISPECIES: DNA-3-methyladenine glycosylase 2 [Rhodanobacter]|uniref:DNA-3-methyladenine glycosylase 2 n=1 Tax=Rhodanobacter TaxID=75309 RepID=UPI00042421C9|nr:MULTISPECIES: DNA-3-methyladenine glycosylase 2 [Rhodanobacter]KZC19678.1 DNA methylase [Rhodanobacter denitrificans]UJJ49651.1 helix-turn-helix domain-containing protein [Rhodanobacter denitrificans]UJM92365.1 helix-turn-helix domain-containing protein [Rhodanobacter denitrificans]UJM95894.1 helix-turn-helix domain-containing protein [Rhodanobacter denitrificans]UJN21275.1 helix-turn-helix domain-containing protein [Rhodanobacter denitrificans]